MTFDAEPSALPERPKSSRTWNTKCKEAIKEVTTVTHIVDDTESLKEVYTLLHDCINILSNAAQKLKEEGLVLESCPLHVHVHLRLQGVPVVLWRSQKLKPGSLSLVATVNRPK